MENTSRKVYNADGSYSEIFFFDDNDNNVDEKEATCFIVRECRADGELIREIWGVRDDTDDEGIDDDDFGDDDIDDDIEDNDTD